MRIWSLTLTANRRLPLMRQGSADRARSTAERRAQMLLPTGAIALGLALLLAGVALAAFHTTGGVYHGIGSSEAGGVGSGQPYAYSGYAPPNDNSFTYLAQMYHLQDNGGLHQQCSVQSKSWARCWGNWGTQPCRKRAYTYGHRANWGYLSPYHWMRGATCPGSSHQ